VSGITKRRGKERLQGRKIAGCAREALDFVNLYSKCRGSNRWPSLIEAFDLLEYRAEVNARNFKVPEPASQGGAPNRALIFFAVLRGL
jgi:hypothetical protein